MVSAERNPGAPDPRRARLRLGLGAAVLLALVALAAAVAVSLLAPGPASVVASPSGPPRTAGASPPRGQAGGSSGALYVHVLGAVARPGLYRLGSGSRAIDAIAAAGGLTDAADQGSVNLARPLTDGEQLVIGLQGAAPPPTGAAANQGGKVNLNTADASALETLPGIGPAMAQRILDWRAANGRFSSVEDLLGITGIGAKTFADLKDLVTV